ncbi:MAG: hypothetical protein HWD86_08000 [Kangiellaceae bacterium]|nr:hypothetical protein [Kangiellaceae bacterium]
MSEFDQNNNMNNDQPEFIHENEEQPQPAHARLVSPLRGFYWLERGLSDIYIPHFKNWFVVGLVFAVITNLIPAFIPQIALLVGVLNPMFLAGALIGANRIYQQQGSVTPTQIFEGFSHKNKANLWFYTAVTIVLVILVFMIIMMLIGPEKLQGLDLARIEAGDEAYATSVLSLFLPILPWMIVLGIALTLATWFAPSLILFHDKKAVPAVFDSFSGGARNILAVIIMLVIAFVSFFVIVLGFSLLLAAFGSLVQSIYFKLALNLVSAALVFPIMISVTYIAYREVFLEDITKSEKSL